MVCVSAAKKIQQCEHVNRECNGCVCMMQQLAAHFVSHWTGLQRSCWWIKYRAVVQVEYELTFLSKGVQYVIYVHTDMEA